VPLELPAFKRFDPCAITKDAMQMKDHAKDERLRLSFMTEEEEEMLAMERVLKQKRRDEKAARKVVREEEKEKERLRLSSMTEEEREEEMRAMERQGAEAEEAG
jgi:hypothetical protein